MAGADLTPRGTLRIGSVRGVPIFIGWSWILIAVFFAWQIGQAEVGGSSVVVLTLALTATVLVAVLGHEVAHALTARAFGVTVHRIVADMWGGHTSFDGRNATPGRSALIAVAGPAANLLLALLAKVIEAGVGVDRAGWLGPAIWMNVALAVFNLLPGLPLDGGQLVESLIWRLTGSRSTGMVVAGWAGRGVVVLFGLYAVVLPLLSGDRPTLWQIAIAVLFGSYLWQGATAALQRATVFRLSERVLVRDVVRPAVVLPSSTPIGAVGLRPEVVLSLDEFGAPTLIMLGAPDGQQPVSPQAPLAAVLTRLPAEHVVESRPEDPVAAVIAAVAGTPGGIVVVTAGGTAYGVVTVADLEAARTRR